MLHLFEPEEARERLLCNINNNNNNNKKNNNNQKEKERDRERHRQVRLPPLVLSLSRSPPYRFHALLRSSPNKITKQINSIPHPF